jgi:RHS repeat-associated protein
VVTDAQGQVVARHDFLPFGEELNPQHEPPDKRLYTGQERDFETGQDYFGYRQLRTDLGRFLAPDPITLVPRVVGAQGVNSYAYVRNNPLRLIDPNGLDAIDLDDVEPLDLYAPGDWGEDPSETLATDGSLNDASDLPAEQTQNPGTPGSRDPSAQQESLAGTIYNETGSLRPALGKNGGTDPSSTTSLSDARQAIGEVVLNRGAAGTTGGVARSDVSKEGRATSQFADCLAAAKAAIAVGGAKTGSQHFYLRSGGLTIVKGTVTTGDQPSWGKGVVPAASYGPFRNPVKAGDVAAGSNIYVDIYPVP